MGTTEDALDHGFSGKLVPCRSRKVQGRDRVGRRMSGGTLGTVPRYSAYDLPCGPKSVYREGFEGNPCRRSIHSGTS